MKLTWVTKRVGSLSRRTNGSIFFLDQFMGRAPYTTQADWSFDGDEPLEESAVLDNPVPVNIKVIH